MSGKAPTRTSSRLKTATAIQPPTTRATRARTATTTKASDSTARKTTKTSASKVIVNKANDSEVTQQLKLKPTAVRKTRTQENGSSDVDREPIMAYLRIRPHLGEEELPSSPYLTPLSDTSVRMTDPQDPQHSRSRYRPSTVQPSSIYTFSHVFLPNTSQSDFFTKTTLPLVRDALQGQNGLLFTYGVTNSGKTYTVQGGTEEGTAGILPRTLDVIFNSIEGLHGDGKYRPVRLHGIEPSDPTDLKPPQVTPEPSLAEVLGPLDSPAESEFDIDPTIVKVDRNYEYTIWVSYAEVYNEKVYDLLASVKGESNNPEDSSFPRPLAGKPLLLSRQALPLRPSPASDSSDSDINGKYIAGLRQFRVHSASQAKALVKLGQLHRRVFGTLANRESSRSHGMVIIKIVKGHRGEKDDPTSLQVSRLTLIDLAGSERTKHTHTTGDRLKEAGNINKSLMVLGQCMEVMRSNQRKIALSLSHEGVGKDGRVDTRDVKKGLALVPFRHSKLTEVLMDYFVGDARAVMIVNVNPYDTGYDENSHVMKFAALAREVYITPAPAPVRRVPTIGPGKLQGTKIKEVGPLTLKGPEIAPHTSRRKVTISIAGHGNGKKASEAILEVLEQEEPIDEQDEANLSDDDPISPLVDALFDEVANLRMQLFEAEMRCVVIEAETREEVMHEMEERMRSVEQMYSRRLMAELEQNEMKTDAKIDMLHQSGLFGSPVKKSHVNVVDVGNSLSEEEQDVEVSLIEYGPAEGSGEESDFSSRASRSPSMSPLAGKRKKQYHPMKESIGEKRRFIPDPPMLLSDIEAAQLTETEENDDLCVAPTEVTTSEDGEDESGDEYASESEEGDYVPPSTLGNKAPKAKTNMNPQVSKLAQQIDGLSLQAGGPDDSVVIVPVKQFRARPESVNVDDDEDMDGEEPQLPIVKKKKRQLSKKPVVTAEGIDMATYAVEKRVEKTAARMIRRLGGN